MPKGSLVGIARSRAAQVHQRKFYRPSDGGVGPPSLAETVVSRVDSQLLNDWPVDNHQG